MKENGRIFYFSAINSPKYEALLKQRLHIGAATNKVISLTSALRQAGYRTYPVSLPTLGKNSIVRRKSSILLREKECPIIFLSTTANPFLRRISGFIGYAAFTLRMVKQQDKVVIYNYSPEYLLALVLLKISKNPAMLDLEDAPLPNQNNLAGLFNKLLFYITKKLTQDRYLTVSKQVADNFNLHPACIIYGATDTISIVKPNKITDDKNYRILYGGTLCHETGLDVFCSAVKCLVEKIQQQKSLTFIITGFGGEREIDQLVSDYQHCQLRIERRTNLSVDLYKEVLLSCHAALSLKLPETEMGATTFPSKVVEITSSGLLLITTKVSDIPILFSSENAIILDSATPECLCRNLLWVIEHTKEAKEISIRGQRKALELFSKGAVGYRLKNFIFPEINYEN